jgi:hypothetical protein
MRVIMQDMQVVVVEGRLQLYQSGEAGTLHPDSLQGSVNARLLLAASSSSSVDDVTAFHVFNRGDTSAAVASMRVPMVNGSAVIMSKVRCTTYTTTRNTHLVCAVLAACIGGTRSWQLV